MNIRNIATDTERPTLESPATTEAPPRAPTSAPPEDPAARARKRWVVAGVMVGIFLSAVEATIVSTAMPTAISQLHGVEIYSLVFAGYMLTSTVTVPLWGKLSDIYGRRGLYVFGVLLFVAGAALCGTARTMQQLVAFRALQGIGAGAVMPLGFTIVGEIFSLEERARFQGVLSSVWGLASIIGPLLGGELTERASWRAVFLVPVPIGMLAALIVGVAYRPAAKAPAARRREVDLGGAALLVLASTAFLLAMGLAGRPGGPLKPEVIGTLLAALALGAAFVHTERRVPNPLVHLELFSIPMFRGAALCGVFAAMAMFGLTSYVPLFVQAVIGTDARQAGLALTPFMVGWVVSSATTTRWALRAGYRVFSVVGMGAVVAGSVALTMLGRDASFLTLSAIMVTMGAGMGASFSPLLMGAQSAVAREQLGVATSAIQFFRSMGGATGVAILGAVLAASLAGGVLPPGVSAENVIDPITRAGLAPGALIEVHDLLADSLHAVFRADVVIAVLALLSSFLVPGGSARSHARGEATSAGAEH